MLGILGLLILFGSAYKYSRVGNGLRKMNGHQTSETDKFLYHVTHDLKANTRALRDLPDWIIEDLQDSNIELPDHVNEHIKMLRAYALNMDRLLEGLTQLSRIGRLADDPDVHEITPLITEAWEKISDRAGFGFVHSGDPAKVVGPRNEILQLLMALFCNAVTHHDVGKGQISVQVTCDGTRVHVDVVDDGPGIPAEYREQVFDALKTLKPKDEDATPGIGLALARKIVASLDGHIAIGAAPSTTGCCVTFDLPAG